MVDQTAKIRKGAVKGRVQALNPKTGRWVKLDPKTGKIVSSKKMVGPDQKVRKKT
jgi:hypothetical protein